MTKRYLFQIGNDIKTYQENVWVTLGTTVNESIFLNNGIEDISLLPTDAWDLLTDTFELLIYTDDLNFTPTTLVLTTEPYTPLDLLDNPVLHVWTQETGTSENPLQKEMVITGYPIISYRYKIEMQEPYVLLQDWSPMMTEDVSGEILITKDLLQTINPYQIIITAEQSDGVTVSGIGEITLYDTEPTLIATLSDRWVDYTIGDNENNKVQYKILLNGIQKFPENGDFTPFETPIVNGRFNFSTKDLLIGETNTIEIIARDEYGLTSKVTLSFLGEYNGLLFADMDGEFYSTDMGEVLKKLDFGTIIAGQTTNVVPIKLINKYKFPVSGIELWSNQQSNNYIHIELSMEETPFIPQERLVWDKTLESEEEKIFYIRITTEKNANSTNIFTIHAKNYIPPS